VARRDEWLLQKWQPVSEVLIYDYQATFSTEQGRRCLQDLMDRVYCTLYEGTDPIAMAQHGGGRAVVHSILDAIDRSDNPAKYAGPETEGGNDGD